MKFECLICGRPLEIVSDYGSTKCICGLDYQLDSRYRRESKYDGRPFSSDMELFVFIIKRKDVGNSIAVWDNMIWYIPSTGNDLLVVRLEEKM